MPKRTPEREKFLGDIITTALEGGIGYWSVAAQYQWVDDDGVHVVCGEEIEGGLPTAIVHEEDDTTESGYADAPLNITIDTIAAGLGKIKRREDGCCTIYDKDIISGDAKNDAGEMDAAGADVIVQIGLFGKLVYG